MQLSSTAAAATATSHLLHAEAQACLDGGKDEALPAIGHRGLHVPVPVSICLWDARLLQLQHTRVRPRRGEGDGDLGGHPRRPVLEAPGGDDALTRQQHLVRAVDGALHPAPVPALLGLALGRGTSETLQMELGCMMLA